MTSLTLTVVPLTDGGNNTVSVLPTSASWMGIPLHERIKIQMTTAKYHTVENIAVRLLGGEWPTNIIQILKIT